MFTLRFEVRLRSISKRFANLNPLSVKKKVVVSKRIIKNASDLLESACVSAIDVARYFP